MTGPPAGPRHRAAWAVGVWALVFAAGSFHLAAGGSTGSGLLADELGDRILARDPALVTVLWLTGAAKLAAALFAVALTREWQPRTRAVTTLLARCTGVALAGWGYGYLVMGALVLTGAAGTPPSWGPAAAHWYVVVWGPWWILGGVLFLAAARRLPRPAPRQVHRRHRT